MEPDFSGWATRANLRCSDGRTILPDAFKHMDGQQIPLLWQHGHKDVNSVLGHGILKHTAEGMRIDAFFNQTKAGQDARQLVEHKDIQALSIYANNLVEKNKMVMHGDIRETSLVLAGANKGALIDYVNIRHSDGELEPTDEAIIFTGLALFHAEADQANPTDQGGDSQPEPSDATVEDVWNSMTPVQQSVVEYMVGAAVQDAGGSDTTDAEHTDTKPGEGDLSHKEGATDMKLTNNVFEQQINNQTNPKAHLLTREDAVEVFKHAQELGSLRQGFDAFVLAHGFDPVDILFPDYKNLDTTGPQLNARRMEWVQPFLDGCGHTPFSRIKTLTGDITMDDARAKGYVKGSIKKNEWFSLSKRVTGPTTVYKKQRMDRDDIIDITDFDVIAWLKAEMQMMLKEEIARAALLGDGREVDDPDKIADPANASSGDGIRSVINENELFKTDVNVNLTATPNWESVVEQVIQSMQYYKGTGQPTLYTTLPVLTNMLLIKDTQGRRLYTGKADLAATMMVADIVPVEAMESNATLLGVIFNTADYNFGADKGGEVNYFDFFDINYNQMHYLLETRVSGALTRIKSAMVLWSVPTGDTSVTPTAPTFVKSTGVATVPTKTGVVYKDDEGNTLTAGAQTAITAGESLTIVATPASGYFFPVAGAPTQWTFALPPANN